MSSSSSSSSSSSVDIAVPGEYLPHLPGHKSYDQCDDAYTDKAGGIPVSQY
jgi:hypothetical protein